MNQRRLKINADKIKEELLSRFTEDKKTLEEHLNKKFESKVKEFEGKYSALEKMSRNQINLLKMNFIFTQAVQFWKERKYAPSIVLGAKAYWFCCSVDENFPEKQTSAENIKSYLINFVNETRNSTKAEFNPTGISIMDALNNIDEAISKLDDPNLRQIKSKIHNLYELG